MTEEHDQQSAGSADQPPPEKAGGVEPPDADVTSPATPAAYTTDVVQVSEERSAEDEGDALADEPAGATRLSPYGVAAFAVSLLALFQAPQNVFTAQGLARGQFLRYILPTLAVPILAAIAGLYFAGRADEEVYAADGRLGGVGFIKAARIISIGVLAIALAAVVLVLFFSDQPQGMQFG